MVKFQRIPLEYAVRISPGDSIPDKILEHKLRQAKECTNHVIEWDLYINPFAAKKPRKYRRGSNRCKRCGCYLRIPDEPKTKRNNT